MRQFLMLTRRNLRVYFRDKSAVFFSLLSTLIVILLMIFFLGDMTIESIVDNLSAISGRDAEADAKNAELFVLSWTGAGILSINAVTVTLAVFAGMIKDKVTGRIHAVYTAPVGRVAITASYVVAAFVASVIICIISLAVIDGYAMMQGMSTRSLEEYGKLLGMIILNSFVFASLMYPLALLAKSEGAWSGIGTVIGTLVGFLGGIYIPIGTLSDSVASVLKCTPVIYSTAMFRSVMNQEILSETFQGAPEKMISAYKEMLGIDLFLGTHQMTITEEWIILFVCGIIFLVIGSVLTGSAKKTDR